MDEWWRQTLGDPPAIVWHALLVRLCLAFGLGVLIAELHRFTRSDTRGTPTFPATLVMLTILIALITQVIGNSVARAFSLVGALSIVRFRTVVRDTKDTAFVIFAVSLGMAVGAGQTVGGLCGFVVMAVAAWVFRDAPHSAALDHDFRLEIRIAWSDLLQSQIQETVRKYATHCEQTAVNTSRQGTAIDLIFRLGGVAPDRMLNLVTDLNRLEGVQSVDLRAERTER